MLERSNKAKDCWSMNKTFRISNGERPLMVRNISCNQLRQIMVIWMLILYRNYRAFAVKNSSKWCSNECSYSIHIIEHFQSKTVPRGVYFNVYLIYQLPYISSQKQYQMVFIWMLILYTNYRAFPVKNSTTWCSFACWYYIQIIVHFQSKTVPHYVHLHVDITYKLSCISSQKQYHMVFICMLILFTNYRAFPVKNRTTLCSFACWYYIQIIVHFQSKTVPHDSQMGSLWERNYGQFVAWCGTQADNGC